MTDLLGEFTRDVMIAARISPSERAAVERLAKANDRTASREVRRAIRYYLAHPEAADAYFRDRAGCEPPR
jgi:predicted transcriptional regulator